MKIKCLFGFHDLHIERALSRQAALCNCSRCHKKWAVKMEGDARGAMIKWENAEEFYKTFPGSVLFNK